MSFDLDDPLLKVRLRDLPAFPEQLAPLLEEDLPANPSHLFLAWLSEAADTGARQPHAMSLATVRTDDTPVVRTLILKNIDERGYHFATHSTSLKGQELSANPKASMLFFWRELGRQVRVTGDVSQLTDEESQQDWAERPNYDGAPNADWRLYALQPREFEFMQARHDRHHVRFLYRMRMEGSKIGWERCAASTPAG